MSEQPAQSHLSQITTLWSVVCQAHQGPPDAMQAARRALIDRYGGAIYRYLLVALRDQDAAEELAQDFALRFVRGDFKNADPERGRFRDFVKSSLFYLLVKFRRRQQAAPRQLGPADEPAVEPDPSAGDEFRRSWRDELLVRAWQALARLEDQTGQPLHTVLRCRTEHAEMPSGELARELARTLGKQVTAVGVRQMLHRARAKFAALLVDEVTHTLHDPNAQHVQDELIDLGLWTYCKQMYEARTGRD